MKKEDGCKCSYGMVCFKCIGIDSLLMYPTLKHVEDIGN